jgi:hypothetical protein
MALNSVYSYFRSYDKSSFAVFSCQGSEPSKQDLQKFEKAVGFSLPDEYREFTLSPLGGLYMEVQEELWPRPQAYQVGPFWSFLYAVKVFGMARDIPDWLDVRVQYKKFHNAGYSRMVPFLQRVGDPDCYCFTASKEIVLWDHEDPDHKKLIDLSFSELLMKEIRELEERKTLKLSGKQFAA